MHEDGTRRRWTWGGAAAAAGAVVLAAAAPTDNGAPLPDPLEAGWKGEPVCERLEEDTHHRLLRCTFPAGSGHERHFHAPHAGYALEGGTMRITDEGGTREVDLPAGSTWTSEGVRWHEVRNVGSTTTSYLIFESKPTPETP